MNVKFDIETIQKAIDSSPWFKGIPEQGRSQLARAAKIKQYTKKSYVFQNGDFDTDIYCVMSGRLRLGATSSTGQEFTFTDYNQGSWFGEATLSIEEARLFDVLVLETSFVLVIPRKDVLSVGEEFPTMYRHIFIDHTVKARGLYRLLEAILFYPLSARLAGRLLEQAQLHGVQTEQGIRLDISLSQSDFANLVMGSRPRVNKIFGQWRDKNIVVMEKGKYLIKNLAALEDELELIDE
nr:Crp/Fnr family transcriptional regulator [uncultured Glaciecola sp.]